MSKVSVKSKIAIFSTLLAIALATISASSVIAAPAAAPTHVNSSLERIWGNQFRDLQTDRAVLTHIKSQLRATKNSSKSAEIQQYLERYIFALNQADAIMIHNSPSSTSIIKVNNRFERSLSAEQVVAMYLHMIRGLQDKLMSVSNTIGPSKR